MEFFDPTTGEKLPSDAIQRVLFLAGRVHVYNIPPLTSTKGHTAATWTEDAQRHIFTCRVRIMETAIPQPAGGDRVRTDVVLEDPSSGQLFAAAPYTSAAAVEAALDSSRFFALRVQDPSGSKATLGIGFEERSEAFDFGVALQDARKGLGPHSGGAAAVAAEAGRRGRESAQEKRDLSLKEGETITVKLGGKFGRRRPRQEEEPGSRARAAADGASLSSFSLPPPPPSGSSSRGVGFSLAPPPSAQEAVKRKQDQKTAKALGFDDGQFGEFA